MKHSRKMMLVDYDAAIGDQVGGFKSKVFEIKSNKDPALVEHVSIPNEDEVLNEWDVKLQAVLSNKQLSDSDKIKYYNDILRRYLLSKNDFENVRERNKSEVMEKLTKKIYEKINKEKPQQEDAKPPANLFQQYSTPLITNNRILEKIPEISPVTSKTSKIEDLKKSELPSPVPEWRKKLEKFKYKEKRDSDTDEDDVEDENEPLSTPGKSYVLAGTVNKLKPNERFIYDPSKGRSFIKRKNLMYEFIPAADSSGATSSSHTNSFKDFIEQYHSSPHRSSHNSNNVVENYQTTPSRSGHLTIPEDRTVITPPSYLLRNNIVKRWEQIP
jgi:hypothetical protein